MQAFFFSRRGFASRSGFGKRPHPGPACIVRSLAAWPPGNLRWIVPDEGIARKLRVSSKVHKRHMQTKTGIGDGLSLGRCKADGRAIARPHGLANPRTGSDACRSVGEHEHSFTVGRFRKSNQSVDFPVPDPREGGWAVFGGGGGAFDRKCKHGRIVQKIKTKRKTTEPDRHPAVPVPVVPFRAKGRLDASRARARKVCPCFACGFVLSFAP